MSLFINGEIFGSMLELGSCRPIIQHDWCSIVIEFSSDSLFCLFSPVRESYSKSGPFFNSALKLTPFTFWHVITLFVAVR